MTLSEKAENLLNKPYFIIDILPRKVEEKSKGQYFEIEEYFLANHSEKVFRNFAELLLKVNCYYDFDVCYYEFESENNKSDQWILNPPPKDIYSKISSCEKEKRYINIIIDNNTMIAINGDFLHLTIYNPNKELQSLIVELCKGYGLYFRKEGATQ